jgi:hypothetical protein
MAFLSKTRDFKQDEERRLFKEPRHGKEGFEMLVEIYRERRSGDFSSSHTGARCASAVLDEGGTRFFMVRGGFFILTNERSALETGLHLCSVSEELYVPRLAVTTEP